jgi:hypothetical protein
MNPTLPRSDEDFARTLRDRLDAAAPTIDVDTSRVVPAARRIRRRRNATALVASAAVLAAGVGWATQPWEALQFAEVSPASVLPYVPSDAAPKIDAGWLDAPYWHVRSESTGTDTTSAERHEVRDTWYGNDRPGLYVVEGDQGETGAFGPRDWGALVIDGARVTVTWERLGTLPTDPAALEQVLRASVEPDRRAGTPDDKVFEMAQELLTGTPAPRALRDALWSVMGGLPQSTVIGASTDALGRSGEAVERTVQGWTTRVLYDPAEHRVLEVTGSLADGVLEEMQAQGQLDGAIMSTATTTTYLEEGPANAPPTEPRLEDSGCVAWETC